MIRNASAQCILPMGLSKRTAKKMLGLEAVYQSMQPTF